MSVLSAAFGGSSHRRATTIIAAILMLVALTLLTIGANSPYTHANLNPTYDARYDRTSQIVLGATEPFGGLGKPVTTGDAVTRGASLYITEGCVSCHALGAQGGAVGKPVAGVDEALLTKQVRQGGIGMPPFSTTGLTDEQLAAIAAYLRSLPAVK